LLSLVNAMSCHCLAAHHPRRIVLTGGPGAGKTAVLETLRAAMCDHVHVLPEAAGIVFGGGFPRGTSLALRRPAQRAIYFVQRELEATAHALDATIIMCDRGTIDSLAYWPGPDDLWESVGSTLATELDRYHAVIHLHTPSAELGYNHSNPLRIETAEEAAVIDERIVMAWQAHPRRFEVPSSPDFFHKVGRVMTLVAELLPPCCRPATFQSWVDRTARSEAAQP
jgi:predicted ATPase